MYSNIFFKNVYENEEHYFPINSVSFKKNIEGVEYSRVRNKT